MDYDFEKMSELAAEIDKAEREVHLAKQTLELKIDFLNQMKSEYKAWLEKQVAKCGRTYL